MSVFLFKAELDPVIAEFDFTDNRIGTIYSLPRIKLKVSDYHHAPKNRLKRKIEPRSAQPLELLGFRAQSRQIREINPSKPVKY